MDIYQRKAVSDMRPNGCSGKLCPMQVGCADNCNLTKEQCPYFTQDIHYHIEKNTLGETHFAIGSGIPYPLTTVINCKKIILAQESIGIEIDVSEKFKRVNSIIVNGVEFVKKGE